MVNDVSDRGERLLDLETSSQQELVVLLSDLDVVDFLLVEDHQGEGLPSQLPHAVPHQVCPILADIFQASLCLTSGHLTHIPERIQVLCVYFDGWRRIK